ncbi:MAG: glycoside hydrolase family 15 protein, partial [Bdellovibrionales bacterium]|nr:glycoside hydrolase family 15 protein [Bdellovibrionales bacterium]
IDENKGGEFCISPEQADGETDQFYINHTNVLVTRQAVKDGVFEVIDFAPRFVLNERYHKPLMLFRKIKRVSGSPRIKIICRPVGEYGEVKPEVMIGSNHLRYSNLGAPVRLTTNASLTSIKQESVFSLTEDLYFVLSWGIPLEGPLITTFEDFLTRTIAYWQTWVKRCNLPREFQEQVIRSALVLKLHQFEDTGAIIAATTTSLPEINGEGRNWDYRFCWLRDTYYTLHALNALGHFEEMEKFSHFIENLNIQSQTHLQPVYCIDGTLEMPEKELPLAGYLKNKPVRIGNGAVQQVQHDAYGQIILAIFNLYADVRFKDRRRLSERSLAKLLDYIEKTMNIPDNGVWEFRGKKNIHTYTILFHWAGSNACQKIAIELENKILYEKASKCVTKAKKILDECYSEKMKAWPQAIHSDELDASLLQLITMGYFQKGEEGKATEHLRAIQNELEISPGFFLRYRHEDDFGEQKSAFLICSFWFIEALVTLDYIEEARDLFDKVLTAQNHLGLMSEDFDIRTKSQWGNFPQTYSHVGLINCAFALDKATKKPNFL